MALGWRLIAVLLVCSTSGVAAQVLQAGDLRLLCPMAKIQELSTSARVTVECSADRERGSGGKRSGTWEVEFICNLEDEFTQSRFRAKPVVAFARWSVEGEPSFARSDDAALISMTLLGGGGIAENWSVEVKVGAEESQFLEKPLHCIGKEVGRLERLGKDLTKDLGGRNVERLLDRTIDYCHRIRILQEYSAVDTQVAVPKAFLTRIARHWEGMEGDLGQDSADAWARARQCLAQVLRSESPPPGTPEQNVVSKIETNPQSAGSGDTVTYHGSTTQLEVALHDHVHRLLFREVRPGAQNADAQEAVQLGDLAATFRGFEYLTVLSNGRVTGNVYQPWRLWNYPYPRIQPRDHTRDFLENGSWVRNLAKVEYREGEGFRIGIITNGFDRHNRQELYIPSSRAGAPYATLEIVGLRWEEISGCRKFGLQSGYAGFRLGASVRLATEREVREFSDNQGQSKLYVELLLDDQQFRDLVEREGSRASLEIRCEERGSSPQGTVGDRGNQVVGDSAGEGDDDGSIEGEDGDGSGDAEDGDGAGEGAQPVVPRARLVLTADRFERLVGLMRDDPRDVWIDLFDLGSSVEVSVEKQESLDRLVIDATPLQGKVVGEWIRNDPSRGVQFELTEEERDGLGDITKNGGTLRLEVPALKLAPNPDWQASGVGAPLEEALHVSSAYFREGTSDWKLIYLEDDQLEVCSSLKRCFTGVRKDRAYSVLAPLHAPEPLDDELEAFLVEALEREAELSLRWPILILLATVLVFTIALMALGARTRRRRGQAAGGDEGSLEDSTSRGEPTKTGAHRLELVSPEGQIRVASETPEDTADETVVIDGQDEAAREDPSPKTPSPEVVEPEQPAKPLPLPDFEAKPISAETHGSDRTVANRERKQRQELERRLAEVEHEKQELARQNAKRARQLEEARQMAEGLEEARRTAEGLEQAQPQLEEELTTLRREKEELARRAQTMRQQLEETRAESQRALQEEERLTKARRRLEANLARVEQEKAELAAQNAEVVRQLESSRNEVEKTRLGEETRARTYQQLERELAEVQREKEELARQMLRQLEKEREQLERARRDDGASP